MWKTTWMGSGFSGKYSNTWSSANTAELRKQVLDAFELAGGALVGGAAVQLAEALVRISMGESVEDIDFPEPGDVAFDLALDALSAFVPGGPAVTRSLSLAAKAGKGASRASGTAKKLTRAKSSSRKGKSTARSSRRIRMSREETARVYSSLNNMYHARLKGKNRARIPIGEYIYTVHIHDFDEYTIIAKEVIV